MTGRPTFGDFVSEARGRLRRDPPPGIAARHLRRTVRTRTVREFARSMASILAVMDRYCADITAVLASAPRLQEAHLPATWARASIQAREAIHNAVRVPASRPSQHQPARFPARRRPGRPQAGRCHRGAGCRARPAAHPRLRRARRVTDRPFGMGTSRHLGAGSPCPAARARALGPADRRARLPDCTARPGSPPRHWRRNDTS